MATLADAIDALLAFLTHHPAIAESDQERFRALDQHVFALAHAVRLLDALPKQAEVERELSDPLQPRLPRVMFLGKTNLPGDWATAKMEPILALTPANERYFWHAAEGRWKTDMLALRALAEQAAEADAQAGAAAAGQPGPRLGSMSSDPLPLSSVRRSDFDSAVGLHHAALACLEALSRLVGRNVLPSEGNPVEFAELQRALPTVSEDPFAGTEALSLNGEWGLSWHSVVLAVARDWAVRLPAGLPEARRKGQVVVMPTLERDPKQLRALLLAEMARLKQRLTPLGRNEGGRQADEGALAGRTPQGGAIPSINLDQFNLTALWRRTAFLVKCMQEYHDLWGSNPPPHEEAPSRLRCQTAHSDVLAEIARLGLPPEPCAGELQGPFRLVAAVGEIICQARGMQITGAFEQMERTPIAPGYLRGLEKALRLLEQATAEIPPPKALEDPYLANIDERNAEGAAAAAQQAEREAPLLGAIYRISEALESVLGPNEPSLETCHAAARTLTVELPAFNAALESSGLRRRPIADLPPPDDYCKAEAEWWKEALLQGKDETTIREVLRRGDRTRIARVWQHILWCTLDIGATSPVSGRPTQASAQALAANVGNQQETTGESASVPGKPARRKKGAGVTIPPDKRTRPMTYREAARYLGKGDSKDAAEWVSVGVEVGDLDCEHISRQQHVFNREQFPMETWQHILPK
jgi:hypothetical protein